uniref:Uncharacterized protein n=1 Tax=Siphoviridae sp. ct6YY1 TaxID=2825343 RepID=A0A8S5V382_9CAUD|nr:MAG TPA: hypothetical protein [Siphoviridae sp. ct6YY1]
MRYRGHAPRTDYLALLSSVTLLAGTHVPPM